MSKERDHEITKEAKSFFEGYYVPFVAYITANFQPILFNALINHNNLIIELFRASHIAPSARIDQLQGFVNSLMAQGYDIHDAPWDGNCFFSSIAQYLNSIGHSTNHNTLRALAAGYINSHPELVGLMEDQSFMILGVAADHVSILALAQSQNLNINIHDVNGSVIPISSGRDDAPSVDLGYTGRHYFLLTQHVEASLDQLLGLPLVGYHHQSDL